MNKITENGILDREEFEAYKERSVKLKFRSQLLSGLGSSTVFGIVGFTTAHLLGLVKGGAAVVTAVETGAAAAGIVWWPLLAIGAMALLGVTAIYFSNRFYTESLMLDQDFNAKKIGHATSLAQIKLLDQQKAVPMIGAQPPQESARDSWAARVGRAKESNWAERTHTATDETTAAKGIG